MAEVSAYQSFVKAYFKSHPGTDMKKAAAAWNDRGNKKGPGRPRRDACASDLVPTEDGSGVTVRGRGGHLAARIEGHTEVQFDNGAIGAIWGGLVERLRQDNGVNLATMFPDIYPAAALAMKANRSNADNRAVGVAMGPLLGAALVAYRVTPEEWAGWYAAFTGQRFVIPSEMGMCVTVSAASCQPNFPQGLPAAAINQAAQFGGVLGAPGGAVLPGAAVVPGGQYGGFR